MQTRFNLDRVTKISVYPLIYSSIYPLIYVDPLSFSFAFSCKFRSAFNVSPCASCVRKSFVKLQPPVHYADALFINTVTSVEQLLVRVAMPTKSPRLLFLLPLTSLALCTYHSTCSYYQILHFGTTYYVSLSRLFLP